VNRKPEVYKGFPRSLVVAFFAAGISVMGGACGGADSGAREGTGLTGQVQIDGSSTVFPVAEAVAEEFQIQNRGVRVTVGLSGSGGGFKRFCADETDISNASREIKDSEREQCSAAGVEFIELPVAWDGLSIVANPDNTALECLTVEELRRIWEPDSRVRSWRNVRASLPDQEIKLYGPGTDSGTFDYFTEAVMGESGASRPDYQASEDDNVLVQGVAGDQYALGYFGFAYYVENTDKLKLIAVDSGSGCVTPSVETIENGNYSPLSRPLYMYVKTISLLRPEIDAYVRFFMENAPTLVPETGYIPLSQDQYQGNLEAAARAVGS